MESNPQLTLHSNNHSVEVIVVIELVNLCLLDFCEDMRFHCEMQGIIESLGILQPLVFTRFSL